MPKQPIYQNTFNFAAGYITEATALNFPAGACRDILNMDLNIDGSVQRRKAIDFESGYNLVDISSIGSLSYLQTTSLTMGKWKNVGGDANQEFAVIQIGHKLHFHDLTALGALSNLKLAATVDLNTYKKPTSIDAGDSLCQFESALGYLFVVSQEIEPIYITYSNGSLTVTKISFKTRDFDGVDDGLKIDERPTGLASKHRYNLYNQGWNDEDITTYHNHDSLYPSNAQISYIGITQKTQTKVSDGGNTSDTSKDQVFDPQTLDAFDFGNTKAPKGHFLLNPFGSAGERNTASGIAETLPFTVITDRPSCLCFYSGRIFYAGRQPGVVYVTATLQGPDQFGQIYQVQDPTTQNFNQLFPNDGVLMHIPECGSIIGLMTVRTGVVVFATNGIWQIQGVAGPFTATNFQFDKLTDITAASSRAIINVEGTPVFASQIGIYGLNIDPITGLLNPQNMSIKTIQTYYNTINPAAKANALFLYNEYEKRLIFLYNNDNNYNVTSNPYKYDSMLVHNIPLNSWTKHAIVNDDTHPFIAGAIIPRNVIYIAETSLITKNGVLVTSNQINVTLTENVFDSQPIRLLLFTLLPRNNTYSYTFSTMVGTSFRDWITFDGLGVNFDSFLETQSDIKIINPSFERLGDAMKQKQNIYVYCYFKQTEKTFISDTNNNPTYDFPSGAYLSIKWDFANSTSSGKWTPLQQVYRFRRYATTLGIGSAVNTGYEEVVSKTKIRGEGKILVFRFDSEDNKDMQLLGFSIPYLNSQSV